MSSQIDKSIPIIAGNIFAILISFPLIMIFVIIYKYIWNIDAFAYGAIKFNQNFIINLIIFIGLIIIHEVIHYLTWGLFIGFDKKILKFGFHWKLLTPYVHCSIPMKINIYKLGAVMPLIILGILPSIYSLIFNNPLVFLYGIIFILAAGGDILVLWMIRNQNSKSLLKDHPSRAGCIIIRQ